jgi:hypothetical protein
MFVTDCAQAGGAQQEVAARSRSLDPKPPCRQHPDEMTTRKYQDVTLHFAQPAHNPARSRPDLLASFATRTAIAKQLPVGPLLKDIGGCLKPQRPIACDLSANSVRLESVELRCLAAKKFWCLKATVASGVT